MDFQHLGGVYAAALTPLQENFSPDLEAIPEYLAFLAGRGCHGALLLGTTGEGPSFATHERISIFRAALKVREQFPDFRLLAGTGTPSLEESAALTQGAFDLGFDGVVTLPPYYFRDASEEGLLRWFSEIIQRSVPEDGAFLGYHFPNASGVALSTQLLSRLKDRFPRQFAGLKDSSGDPEHAQRLGHLFGADLLILTGNDRLFSMALDSGASGCITAMANLRSPDLRAVWDAYKNGEDKTSAQERLDRARLVLDDYAPFASSLKALLPSTHDFPRWPLRPPLMPLSDDLMEMFVQAFSATRK
ncbi:MAG: dihydrodipicolinate synthase family protein [Chloroflexota bacterium]